MNRFKYFIATLGGFQFGYTVGIMAGALLFLISDYNLTLSQQGIVASAVLFGAIPGAASGGVIAEVLGNRRGQQAVAVLFFIGAIIVMSSTTLVHIIAGRVIQGIASGAITVLAPMYLAEVSPPETRGRYVGYYQLAVTIGILSAYTISYLLSQTGNWQWMFGFGMFPPLIHGIGFSFLPDPIYSEPSSSSSWKTIFSHPFRAPLIAAVLVNIFQQITGVNAVVYFAPSIFEMCGVHPSSRAIFFATLIGVVNTAATFLSLRLIDKKGRRPLLLIGLAGMTLALTILAVACFAPGAIPDLSQWLSTGSLMLYIASFAIGLGFIPFVLPSELFPHSVRSQAVTISLFVNWIFNFLVVFTFLDFTVYLSHAGTFLLYAAFGAISFYLAWKHVPETKGTILH